MKTSQLLALPLLSFLLFSCDKEEITQPASVSNTVSVETSQENNIISIDTFRKNLLIEERFENPLSVAYKVATNPTFDYYEPYYRIFRAKDKSYAFNVYNGQIRNGKTAARFEMRGTDPEVVRAEFAGKKAETNRNRWYAASVFLPGVHWNDDNDWDIITQMNGVPDPGEPARNPAIALFVSRGRLKLTTCYASQAINTNTKRDGSKTWDLGPVEKSKWLDFVFHVNYSYSSDGVLELWKNGVKILDYRGPNSYNDKVLPYYKVGIYKRNWDMVAKRVLYVDDVRVGNEFATYKDVAPTGTPVK